VRVLSVLFYTIHVAELGTSIVDRWKHQDTAASEGSRACLKRWPFLSTVTSEPSLASLEAMLSPMMII
jgi:hypothetical protein